MSEPEIKVPGQIDTEAIVISEASAGLEVTDKASADRASEIIVAGKKLIKAIKDYFDPMKKAADEAKRRILETERQELSKIEPIVSELSAKVSRWLADEERRRREAEEARRQAELERLRLEAELEVKAREAEQIKNESERRRVEDRIIAEVARREAELEPIPDVPVAAKADGVNLRDNWTFEIVDESLIPREYLIPDEVKIRKVVIALKDKTNIPGIKAVNRPIIVKSRGV
jgi:cell division septum initiation protein DivIVA